VHTAVVAVGDELLLGDVVNGNLAWLGRVLADAGVPVVAGFEVGDAVADIVGALRTASAAVGPDGAVVLTGGLGPTSDDRTRQALADAAGVRLVRHEDLAAGIARWYDDRGRDAPAAVFVQAQLPAGATAIENRRGTAPGIAMEIDGRAVYAVPGVPAELRGMVDSVVVPELRARAGAPPPLVTRQLRVAMLGESLVAARLEPLEAVLPVGVALSYLASLGEVRVRFSGTEVALLDQVAERAAALLGDAVSGRDGETLPATVLRMLTEQGATVAVAESLTGGALAAALVDIPGSSSAFVGGVVAYATTLKTSLLGVDHALLAAGGPVQAEVALAMARGVRSRLGATYGLATTGVAGPEPVDGVPAGTAYVAVAGPVAGDDQAVLVQLPGGRDRVRSMVVVQVLDLLRGRLGSRGTHS
jgi:nicotinamide-nucleotide amidase